MSQKDTKLGWALHEHLKAVGLETPMSKENPDSTDFKIEQIEHLVSRLMTIIGLDLTDDSLTETPHRVAKMYVKELMGGLDYDQFPKCTTVENKFFNERPANEIQPFVLLKNLKTHSLCEHHLLPIKGNTFIAYVPGKQVLGLSKFQRIVDFFAARPQVQERLTEQIAEAICFVSGCESVAVFMDATHDCMTIRGVESPCSSTATLATRGEFSLKNSSLRAEFLAMVHGDK